MTAGAEEAEAKRGRRVSPRVAAHLLLVHLGALRHHDNNKIIDADVSVLIEVKVEESLVDGLLVERLTRSAERGQERVAPS